MNNFEHFKSFDPEPVLETLELPVGHELEIGGLVGPLTSRPLSDTDAIVYFPGLTSSKHYFEDCLKSPHLAHFLGFSIDSLGMGDSACPHPDLQSYRIEEQALLINEAINLVLERLPPRSVSFVAHSWGEALALACLRAQPRELKSFVSVAGGVTGGPIEHPELFTSDDFIEAMLPSMVSQTGSATTNASLSDKAKARRILRESISSFIEAHGDLQQVFANLSCSKYFIAGSNDVCGGSADFTDKVEIAHCGHNVVLEAPDAFASTLLVVLEG